ncbi:integrase arm-type DNA-binding domain-containing protein [Shewanella oneidensis MR-1]|uniref:Integrase bacteriophage P4 family n=2 Tax=Shewanella oneidensis TaxID=70863 RepID=Q8EJS4_SHEON|nr:site-specific integrase [Shewanella oneidensis]AAN53471.1 integrase bacteriophage P4 family [Shewanella oneidensis MR-1]MDX5997662.1 integrase arm-type DNA-binding domain-containing protein [Shewanella oneidensis]MEE2027624.1 Prophage integrase IntA [Shewanella oneidensis]QKG95318.1 integrase arm-type DNA-binding domain-containing protein [Shewanella oneidensis MR-1]
MATKKNMTNTALVSLTNKPLDKPTTLSDSGGLAARATPAKDGKGNNVLWIFRYRMGGRETPQRTIVFGKYPDLKLAGAREKRERCKVWIADGKDPKTQLELELSKAVKPLTVAEVLDNWISEYANGKRVNASKHKQQFERWIVPHLGSLPLAEIKKPHWIAALKKRSQKYPVAAGYVLRNLQQALKWCAKSGHEFDRSVFDIDLDDIGAKHQAKRSQRLVEDDSWQRLIDLLKWIEAGEMLPYYKNLLILLITFGARTQELRLATTKEFNFETGVWTVPAEHNKTQAKDQARGDSGEIKRPIPDSIKPLLVALCEANKGGYLLGEFKEPTAVSAWGGNIWKKLGHEQKWRLHDLRRTVATGLNDLGVAPHVVESLLGHSIQGVAGIYNRSHYLPEKRQALELWCNRLDELLSGEDCNVFLLRASNDKRS